MLKRPGTVHAGTLVGLSFAMLTMPASGAEGDDSRKFQVHVGHRYAFDDNIFRLPDGIDPAELPGLGAGRDEVVASTFLGMAGRWRQGRQEFLLDSDASTNRFGDYSEFDNTSGQVGTAWNWQLGSRWSGRAGGRTQRTLASFANSTALEKDLIDTTRVESALRFDIGPRWTALADARRSRTRHGSDLRRGDDVDLDLGRAGLEFRTPSANIMGWTYTESRATFARAAAEIGSSSDYEERTLAMNFEYALTTKLAVNARFGRLERAYPQLQASDFSGATWDAALSWAPTTKSVLALRRWHEPRAHADAESEHFISSGTGVTLAWSPIATVDIAFEVSSERHRYIVAGTDAAALPGRSDEPGVRNLRFAYTIREHVVLDISYRNESRESNRMRFDYGDESFAIGCRVSF
jgi:hypothetical protein